MGFLTLLKKIRDSYHEKRDLVARSAGELSRMVRQMLAPAAAGRLPVDGVIDRAVSSARTRFDAVHGGIGGAPQVPLFPAGSTVAEALSAQRGTRRA